MRKTIFSLLMWVSLIAVAQNEQKLAIIHTNDTHSQIESFGKNAREDEGKAGLARRATLIKELRAEYPNLLLVDAGDFLQGTPYFNFFNGEVEVKAMNALGYDVVTLGNHEFDNGVEFLAKALQGAQFEVVSSNYDFGTTPLADIVKPYVVKVINGQRIGIVAVCINPSGLVTPANFAGVEFRDPYTTVESLAERLRRDEGCSMIVCLSHLGHDSKDRPADLDFARLSKSVDLIVGGHTHTKLQEALVMTNATGNPIVVTQAGSKGQFVGKLIYEFK